MKVLWGKRKLCKLDNSASKGLHLLLVTLHSTQSLKDNLYMAIHVLSLNILVGGIPQKKVVSVTLKEIMSKT